jgi:ectoine hydroxylase-related dioxygenase (phytanoyl-CoA dioxygenase family)
MSSRKAIEEDEVIFTTEQIEKFKTEGYLAVPEFWDTDEIAAMQAEVDRLKAEGKLTNVATEGDGKTQSAIKANLQLCPMSPHSALFRTLPFASRVIQSVQELIGDPVVLHLDQVFLKPAKHGAGTNWHQDNAYFKVADPLKGTAMWTAIHDATLENGTIHVIPRAFSEPLEHSRDPYSNHHIRCYPDESRAIPLELPAGGAAFFAYGTPHATGANTTDRDRAGAAFHFLNGDAIPEDYFATDVTQEHPVLTGVQAGDGGKEYGERIEGTWPEVVRTVLRQALATSVS